MNLVKPNIFLVLLIIYGEKAFLLAASPSYEPAPLRNNELMFEMSVGGSKKIKLGRIIEKKPDLKKKIPGKKRIFNKKLDHLNSFFCLK